MSEGEDESLVFNLLFTIPQLDSAFMRNPAGGARMKVDIDPATVADANRMLDLMSKSHGVVFAAAVVVVTGEIEQNRTDDRETAKTEVKRRAAKRPTDLA